MARKRRRKFKFSPFRMSQRFEKGMLVVLGVFLMVIFAVPFGGSCQRQKIAGRDPGEVYALVAGKKVTYGDLVDLQRRYTAVFGRALPEGAALSFLAHLAEAERAGIRISDAEVEDAIRNGYFARRVRVEYIIARESAFGSSDRAKDALLNIKAQVDATVGQALRSAFRRLGGSPDLESDETDLFSGTEARNELWQINTAPQIVDRVFTGRIGRCSEPLPIAQGWCLFRVTRRTRGFAPDGRFYRGDEGWVTEGYGTVDSKSYQDLLRERRLSQVELERTIRENLIWSRRIPGDLILESCAWLPEAACRARYRRDNTQAVAAYFAISPSDFTNTVTHTEEDLRTFYAQHADIERTDARPGYLEPERVVIECLLGRKAPIERALDPEKPEQLKQLQKHHRTQRARFPGTFDDERAKVRSHLAETELDKLIMGLVADATRLADSGETPDLEALAKAANATYPGAFAWKTTPAFGANELERRVRELRGAEQAFADGLFGDRGQQYVVGDAERKEGQVVVSSVFACAAGRFFFRVLERTPSRRIPYDQISKDTRKQLIRDVVGDKAFRQAQETGRDYRAKVHKDAFDRFAKLVGVQPVETEDFLAPESPFPGVDEPVPAIYDQLILGEEGDLSHVVGVGERFVLARTIERERDRGLRLQVLAFAEGDFRGPFEPASYELQERYADHPFHYLDKPQPIPLDDVKGDIRKLLARRRALDRATEELDTLRKELLAADEPDLPPAAEPRQLEVTRNLKVDLAKTEAAPRIGKAAGFHDAVAELKLNGISPVLSSAEGRFLFVVKGREDQTVTIDVAAVLYDPLAQKTEVKDDEIAQYYEQHRDTAYVTKDEIKEPPAWKDLPAKASGRLRDELRDEWAKKPLLARLNRARESVLMEAFRTVPAESPLTITRNLKLRARTRKVSVAKPTDVFEKAEVLQAVRALEVGALTQPLPTPQGALIACLAEKKPNDILDIDYVLLDPGPLTVAGEEPEDAQLKARYEAHKEDYRQVRVELLGVPFRDVDPDLPKARREAKRQLDEAAKALREPGAEADFDVYAESHKPLQVELTSFFPRDRETFGLMGHSKELATKAFAAKEGEIVGPILGSRGACLLRRYKTEPTRLPTFEDARADVLRDWRREKAVERGVAAAGKLGERIAAALENAEDKRAAFKAAIQDEPFPVQLPKVVRVTLADPFYPVDAGRGKSSEITGLGKKDGLVRAIFRLQRAQLSTVVDDPKQTACYVALLTRVIDPAEPTPDELRMTRGFLYQVSAETAMRAWNLYVQSLVAPAP